MKSLHILSRSILLFLAVFFFSYSASAQLSFKFKFTNEYYAPLHTTPTYYFPSDSPGDISLDDHMFQIFVDLSDQICEGDVVTVDNFSGGSYGSAVITGTTDWDGKWGTRTYDGGGAFTGWNVFSNFPINEEPWSSGPYEKDITIPNSADDSEEFTYHRLYVAPHLLSYYFGAYDSSAGCSRVLEITLKVRTAPRCLDDLSICPGDIIDDNSLGMTAGVTAGSWSPADPRISPPTETTDYSYTLDNGVCTYECSMRIEVNNPDVDFTDITTLCYDDVFTFTEDDFWNLWTADTYAQSIIVDGEVYEDDDDFPIVISAATHGTGIVNIEYNYYMGTKMCSKIYEIQIFPEIVIDLPISISMCDSDYETLCGPLSSYPSPIYNYEWQGPGPGVLSTSRCFTPDMPGTYTLTVTDENGCSKTHTIHINFYSPLIPELSDVYWCPEDMTMPIQVGWFSDPFADHPCTPSYQWTFNGSVIEGANTYSAPFLGNGTYCVMISFEFFSVTRCFEVIECCPPNTAFSVNWMSNGDGTYSIVLTNVSSEYYVSDTYVLEKDCNNDGVAGPWGYVGEITREEDFDSPTGFGDLDPNCLYRITHRVPSPCKMQVFVHTEYVGGNPGIPNGRNHLTNSGSTTQQSLSIFPNPTAGVANLFIKDIEGVYQVDIYNLQGQLLKSLQANEPSTAIDLSELESGIYLLKASNGTDNFSRRIVKI